MEHLWQEAARSLSGIKVISHPNNDPVTIEGAVEGMRCVGVGTDAAVFQSLAVPQYAFKVYADGKEDKLEAERKVYNLLGSSSFFSACYGATDQFLVLKFEEGPTLFDCLLQGIYVPKQAIEDVEHAKKYVRERGLNPRDIHLNNIILQNGHAKLIDVSE